MTGRSAARVRYGLPIRPTAVKVFYAAAVAWTLRRVKDAPAQTIKGMRPPPPNQRGPCLRRLAETRRLDDEFVTQVLLLHLT